MNTLLTLSSDANFARTVQTALNGGVWRIVPATDVAAAEPFLRSGMAQALLMETNLTGLAPIRILESLKKITKIPILLFVDERGVEWEEEAYLQGAHQIFQKPVRPVLLKKILEPFEFQPQPSIPSAESFSSTPPLEPPPLQTANTPEALAQELLSHLRRALGINRAAIYLCDGRDLHCVSSCGMEKSIPENLPLTLDQGIAAALQKTGRILDAHAPEQTILGTRWALPWQDNEGFLGAIFLDDPLIGGTLSPAQLQSVFQFCETVGASLRRLQKQTVISEQARILADALDRKGCGVYVMAPDGKILHESTRARALAGISNQPKKAQDLPLPLAGAFQKITRGEGHFEQEHSSVRAQAFKESDGSVFLLLEDITEQKKSQTQAIETAGETLVRAMAEHFAHEIGNALSPLSTHQQLLAARYDDPEFRDSLSQTMAESVRRITRLGQQVAHLSQKEAGSADRLPLDELVYESFRDAQAVFGGATARLLFSENETAHSVMGNRKAFRHALGELFLNALQSSNNNPQVRVEAHEISPEELEIRITDNGAGFTDEAMRHAFAPFYSTRSVGLGLGLTVAKQIAKLYGGALKIIANTEHGATLALHCKQGAPARKSSRINALN